MKLSYENIFDTSSLFKALIYVLYNEGMKGRMGILYFVLYDSLEIKKSEVSDEEQMTRTSQFYFVVVHKDLKVCTSAE